MINLIDMVWLWYYQRRSVDYSLTPFERMVARRRVTLIREEYQLRRFKKDHQEVYSDL